MKEMIRSNYFIKKYLFTKRNKKIKKYFIKDSEQFIKYAGINETGNIKQIRASLLFYAHSIEKGLSHEHFRSSFGKRALGQLYENMIAYIDNNDSDNNDMEYINALSVLKAYASKHDAMNIEINDFHDMFDKFNYTSVDSIGGTRSIRKDEENVRDVNFDVLAKARHSVREFSDEPVDLEKVKKAVQTSIYTPSVCNRQPWKVYVTSDKNKIERLLKIQGGFSGYTNPPVLSLVTVDLSSFLDVTERNEPFVDGGLFSMSFLYALTNQGLATCTLNTMLPEEKLLMVRNELGITESEILAAFIIIGNYKEDYKIAKSSRKNFSDILEIVN